VTKPAGPRMPRWLKPKVDTPLEQATALVAASTRLKSGQVKIKRWGGDSGNSLCEPWQAEAWEHYDECGQLRYIVNLAADMMSRARLYLTQLDENDEPMETAPATPAGDPMPTVFGGPTGQKAILQQFGIQLGVPGDCTLIGEQEVQPDQTTGQPTKTGRERWSVLSLEEFYEDAEGRWVVDTGLEKRYPDMDTTVAIRVWKQHPRRHDLADSQVKANRRPLRILARLSKYVQAILDSRLAGPGILLLPKELTFAQPDVPMRPDTGGNAFMDALTESMTTAIEDPDSVSSVVPIVVQGPAEQLKEARLLSFASQLSENLSEIETQAIKSLALGLDAPPEMLLGLADTNHWSAWQLEEATIKYVVEPLLELVCAALTESFVWPVLDGQDGIGDVRRWLIWYDPSEMQKRPDKGTEAQAVHGVGELSGAALRRETGFSDDDAPTPAEREYRSLLDLCKAVPAVAPQVAPRILMAIAAIAAGQSEISGPDLKIEPPPEPPPAVGPAPAAPAAPPPPADPAATPDTQNAPAGLLAAVKFDDGELAAVEMYALQVLTSANNRNVGRARHSPALADLRPEQYHLRMPVLPASLPKLLAGMDERVGFLAQRLDVDAVRLNAGLYEYVVTTLTAAMPHDMNRLRDHLEAAVRGDEEAD
jgi:hypothetical protein